MKKMTIGLIVATGVVVVLIAAAAAVFYVRVYSPTAPLVTLVSTANLEDRLLRQKEFTEPASDELTEAQVTKFTAVEREVEGRLGARLADVRTAYERLVPSDEADVRHLATQPVIAALGPVRLPFLAAKMAQIDAMNQATLSKAEFEWVRLRMYRAAGLRLRQVDFSDMEGDLRAGGLRVKDRAAGGSVPPRNLVLTRAIASDLQRWIPLAFWGL